MTPPEGDPAVFELYHAPEEVLGKVVVHRGRSEHRSETR